MNKDELLKTLCEAREHKKNKRLAEALTGYETIYQTYVDGYHQHYNYALYSRDDNRHLVPLPNEVEPQPPASAVNNWETSQVRANFFPAIVNEYTECLILLNNPNFCLETNEIYKRMIAYNTYDISTWNPSNSWLGKKYGEWEIYKMNYDYPFIFKILQSNHEFKNGSWKGVALWELEMTHPEEIQSMVEKTPNIHSDSKLDLAVNPQFFLSKYRIKNKNFYAALEANYSKISASMVWEGRQGDVANNEEGIQGIVDDMDEDMDRADPSISG